MRQQRFSTSTLAGKEFVPWLASAGELAYSPHAPPLRDYFFQYSWIIPQVFCPCTNMRRHFWFGAPWKDCPDVRLLFAFWNRARQSQVDALYLSNGTAGPADVTAPIALYLHSEVCPSTRERLILMQHGSYLIVEKESQPAIDRGEAILYRGVQQAETYSLQRLISPHIRERLMNIHARSLADSVTSFNVVHCNVSRSETTSFNDRSFVLRDLCLEIGLEPEPKVMSLLYSGYALEEWCAIRKFGPNYVKFRTPLTNIRITTFVCNETEVKVVDPNKLEVIEVVGCRIREVCI